MQLLKIKINNFLDEKSKFWKKNGCQDAAGIETSMLTYIWRRVLNVSRYRQTSIKRSPSGISQVTA